jgi:hypothetical protein
MVGTNMRRKEEVITIVVKRLLLQGSRINSMTDKSGREE